MRFAFAPIPFLLRFVLFIVIFRALTARRGRTPWTWGECGFVGLLFALGGCLHFGPE